MLAKLRKEIDQIDQSLVKLLKQRKKLVERVGLFKKKNKLMIFSQDRENEIKKKLDKLAKKFGLRKTFLERLWLEIIKESKVIQKKIKK